MDEINEEDKIDEEKDDEENEVEYRIEEAEEHTDDKDFMLNAIKHKATWVLAYASDNLLSDRDLILQAVKKDGQVLYFDNETSVMNGESTIKDYWTNEKRNLKSEELRNAIRVYKENLS